jgi:hypothetical protein
VGDKKEYIERYKAIRKVAGVLFHMPAADVVEVRNGEWIESTHWGVWYYNCPFLQRAEDTKHRRIFAIIAVQS